MALGGRRPALEAVRSGRAVEILVGSNVRATPGLEDVRSEAARAGVAVRLVPERELDTHGPFDHQGVIAIVRPPAELDERHLLGLADRDDGLMVMLDGVEDPQNLGACARSAEAAGAAALIVRTRRSAGLSAGAVRASAGALLHLPLASVTNLSRTIAALADHGYTSVGLDHRAESTIHEVEPPERPVLVVVGGEGSGISRLVRERCDLLVRLPMPGRVASLNASAALAAGLFGFVLRPPGDPGRTMLGEAGVAQSGSASDL
jgi:23S rRNA (guanosine2251-2'-O)-methyltransferase